MVSEHGKGSLKTWHLLFEGWPDFLVPEGANREALINLITLSREKNLDNSSNPRVVHCSAGVGRSGTFIALDWLLQELEEGGLDDLGDDEDPVTNVVSLLRKQRMMMVQGEAQFNFLYDVIRERWRARWAKSHPEEAERLGLSAIDEHRSKKQKQTGESGLSQQSEGDEDEHAELEAELMDADLQYENGKT